MFPTKYSFLTSNLEVSSHSPQMVSDCIGSLLKGRYVGIRISLSAFAVPSLLSHPSLSNASLTHQALSVVRPFLEDIGIRITDTISRCSFSCTPDFLILKSLRFTPLRVLKESVPARPSYT